MSQHDPDIKVVVDGIRKPSIFSENGFGLLKWIDDQTGQNFRAYGMKLKFKSGNDAEIAATAADGPEQVRVFIWAGLNSFCICSNDFG